MLHSCCHNGQAMAPPLSEYPNELKELLTGPKDDVNARNFWERIQQIIGEVYHSATSVLVEESPNRPEPRFSQVFIYDHERAVGCRMEHADNEGCDQRIMKIIDDALLRRVNPYARQYRNLHVAALEAEVVARARGEEAPRMELRLTRKPTDDPRQDNDPAVVTAEQLTTECMYLLIGAECDEAVPRFDLAVHPKGVAGCRRLPQCSQNANPMTFPLLFPLGDCGWSPEVRNAMLDDEGRPVTKRMTRLRFYSSRIAVRGCFNPLQLEKRKTH